jgi:hypothetical protein
MFRQHSRQKPSGRRSTQIVAVQTGSEPTVPNRAVGRRGHIRCPPLRHRSHAGQECCSQYFVTLLVESSGEFILVYDPPSCTDFDSSVVPLSHYAHQVEANMETPSRIRDSRRSRVRCGRAAAKWRADGRSQMGRSQIGTRDPRCPGYVLRPHNRG